MKEITYKNFFKRQNLYIIEDFKKSNILFSSPSTFVEGFWMKFVFSSFAVFLFSFSNSYSQVENINIYHPVYKFLLRAETKGILEHQSLNDLPLIRSEVVSLLKIIRSNSNLFSSSDLEVLENYEKEFEISNVNNQVLISSKSDSNQILFKGLISDDEKYIFFYHDTTTFTRLKPLLSLDLFESKNENSDIKNAFITNLGFRFSGTISNQLGYNLQVTNGYFLSGDRNIALHDSKYGQNVKFVYYNSDIDFTESHINYKNDWFNAYIGRESRLIGAGFKQRLILNDNSPAIDAITLSAKFDGFEYKFTHASLLAFTLNQGTWQTGFGITIPQKHLAIHRFALKPSWGEIGFWETIVYSDRPPDLAYLNPISFFKSLEHALRDRDNAGMGIDGTVRLFDFLQIKGTYFLDDVRFEMIGKNYWGNKSAFNIGAMAALNGGFDAGFEYSRIEPFTYSHFNRQNSMTNDGFLFSSYLMPNSDKYSLFLDWWWGSRYPLELEVSYMRHGRNVHDKEGNIIKNVGGDPLYTKNNDDLGNNTIFLDGDVLYLTSLDFKTGFELVRGFNLMGNYKLTSSNGSIDHLFRLIFRFDEF
jgi:hypothetical protein